MAWLLALVLPALLLCAHLAVAEGASVAIASSSRKLLQTNFPVPTGTFSFGGFTGGTPLPSQAVATPTATAAPSSSSGDSWGRKNLVWIVIVAVVVFIILHIPICFGCCMFLRWFRRKHGFVKPKDEKEALRTKAPAGEKMADVRDWLPKAAPFNNQIRPIPLEELEEATHNWSSDLLLGTGATGEVFKGRLKDGTIVAIKRRIASREGVLPQFENEAQILSRLMHPNLVHLVGWCDEGGEQALIFPYCTNGSLYKQLAKEDRSLSWVTRLRIAVGAAAGLEFLHMCNVIHRDVKSSNVLLDHEYTAKLSDCGISRDGPVEDKTHISTGVKGTIGYLDPEYYLYHQLTQKSDVYSFGVVLCEIITGLTPIDLRRPVEQHNLLVWAKPKLASGEVDELLDPRLAGKVDSDSLKQVADLAYQCLSDNSKQRPTMAELRQKLDHCLRLEMERLEKRGALAVDVNRLDTEGSTGGEFPGSNNFSMGSTFGALVTPTKTSETEATTPGYSESTDRSNTGSSM